MGKALQAAVAEVESEEDEHLEWAREALSQMTLGPVAGQLGDKRLLIAAEGQEPRWPYSIAGAPEDAERDGWLELLVGVDAEGHPASPLTLELGAAVDIEGPVGRFTFPVQPR